MKQLNIVHEAQVAGLPRGQILPGVIWNRVKIPGSAAAVRGLVLEPESILVRKLRSVSEHEAESREPIQEIGFQWNTGYQ